jgi:hypothetical protein
MCICVYDVCVCVCVYVCMMCVYVYMCVYAVSKKFISNCLGHSSLFTSHYHL